MTFGDEWAQLVSEARQRQSAGMRLNQLEPGSGGTRGEAGIDLVVTQDDLGTVGHEAFLLHGELYTTLSVWDSQVKTVLRCAHTSRTTWTTRRSCTPVTTRRSLPPFAGRDGTAMPVSEISKHVR